MPEVRRERSDPLIDIGASPVPPEKAATGKRMSKVVDPRAPPDRRVRFDDGIEEAPHDAVDGPRRERGPRFGHEERPLGDRRDDRVATGDVPLQRQSRRRMQRNESRLAELGLTDREQAGIQVRVGASKSERLRDTKASARE